MKDGKKGGKNYNYNPLALDLSEKEAKSLLKFMQYFNGFKPTKPTEDDYGISDTLAQRLYVALKRHEDKLEVRQKREKEGEMAGKLRKLAEEQAKDMQETGHGKLEEMESEVEDLAYETNL